MAFKFNNAKVDGLFRQIILNDEGAFPFALLRKTTVKNEETLAVKEQLSILQSGTANWNHPEEMISYMVDGVRRDVDGIIFVPTPTEATTTDVVYNTLTDKAYRVMGFVPYSSHVELHVEEYSLGTSFTLPELPQPDIFLAGDVEVV